MNRDASSQIHSTPLPAREGQGGESSSTQIHSTPLPTREGQGGGSVAFAFNFLWAHRKQNAWIFAEIALIAALSFYFIDHFVVTTYDTYFCRPAGDFERGHLLVGQVGIKRSLTPDPSPKADTISLAPLYALRDQIRALPEVEHAGFAVDVIGQGYGSRVSSYASEADSARRCGARSQTFLLHEQNFETMGLTPIEGSPSAERLSEDCPPDGVVITRSLARALFGTDEVVGRRMVEWDYSDRALRENGEPEIVNRYTIAGVVEDFRMQQSERYAYSILIPVSSLMDNTPKMIIRLRPEADAEAFVSHFEPMKAPLSSGYGLASLKTYEAWERQANTFSGMNQANTLLAILLVLFLLNVVLGTLGTYWLQIRKRTEDIGIMRSFGAKRRHIFGMVWSEAALLALAACLVGQFIYLQFAINIDLLSDGMTLTGIPGTERDWVSRFWPHFLTICCCQDLLLVAVVSLGVTLPAWLATRLRPVDALRQE